MFSKLLENKLPIAYFLTLIFSAGVLYQRSEANTAAVRAVNRTYVRADVQAERNARIDEKLDALLEQVRELKTEIRSLKNRY